MRTYKLFLLFFAINLSAQEKIEVYFDFNQYTLNDAAVKTIDDFLNTNQEIEVSKIYGFCDDKGSNAYNDTLSLKRVAHVRLYLDTKGVTIRKDHETKGFGEDFRQSDVQSENRKVLIVFEKKIAPPVAKEPILADKVKTAKKGDKIKLDNINFLNNSATILPRSKPIISDLLCIMQDNPNLKIEIQGHICCKLTADLNDISTLRARAIYNYLIRNKISKNRLSYKGYGTQFPIYQIPEKSDAEEIANRRVEILIVDN